MVGVAQLVRVSDCGPEGRGFDPHLPPSFFGETLFGASLFFVFYFEDRITKEHKKIFFLPQITRIITNIYLFVRICVICGLFFEHKFLLIIRKFFVSIVLIYD